MEHLEGKQSVFAALTSMQRRFDVVLIRHGTHAEQVQDILDLAGQRGVAVRYVDAAQLDNLAHGRSHGGVIAVVSPKPRATIEEVIERLRSSTRPPLMLLLEGVEDARNLGFVLRSAEAFGADAVLIKKHLWDLDPVEISRPSSGAYERMMLVQVEEVAQVKRFQSIGIRLLGCLAGVKRSVFDADLTPGMILAIGGEKRGLSGALRGICDGFVTIPTVGGASSLSLSHASGIVLAEAFRQRLRTRIETPSTPPNELPNNLRTDPSDPAP